MRVSEGVDADNVHGVFSWFHNLLAEGVAVTELPWPSHLVKLLQQQVPMLQEPTSYEMNNHIHACSSASLLDTVMACVGLGIRGVLPYLVIFVKRC